MPRIVVLGNFVVDLIGKPVDRLPGRGRLLTLETLETHVGGNGPNTAGALGKLGADVAAAGRVGDDLYGRFLTEHLERWGVDTRPVVRDPERATGVTFVAVDGTGERSFLFYPGANADFGPDDLEWSVLADTRHLHLASYFIMPRLEGDLAVRLLADARRRGLTTSVDVCWDRTGRWMDALRPCLPHVDLLMPSEEEARELTGRSDPGEMVRALHDAGARTVVLKRGERGCRYSGAEGELSLPAYRVAVRETTGAGDCFIAGFLHGRTLGWDVERALRFANACGARSVGAVGAVTGLGPAADVEAWAAEQSLRRDD